MQAPDLKLVITSIADSLAALTANQAMMIELLHDRLPSLSETEVLTVEKCASNNYTIAESIQDVLQQLRSS